MYLLKEYIDMTWNFKRLLLENPYFLVPPSLCQFSSSLCKAPYHGNVKSYTDLGQLNCGVFRPQVHLILIKENRYQ